MKSRYPKRWVAFGFLGLFLISCLFPVIASFMPDSKPPTWIGTLDVSIAFLLVVIGFALYGTTRTTKLPREEATLIIIQSVSASSLVLLLIFLTGKIEPRWDILLPGLAWRYWLVIMVIPALMKIFFTEKPSA